MFKTVIPKLPAQNVQQAVTFYEQKLGFRALFDYRDYASVERYGLEIHLWECHDPSIVENTAFRLAWMISRRFTLNFLRLVSFTRMGLWKKNPGAGASLSF